MAYHSKFGGLWIDDTDHSAVSARLATIADHATREQVGLFIRDGYVIIEQAVDHAAIDAYLREYEAAADTRSALQIEVPSAGGRQEFTREKSRIPGSKVLDTGMLTRHGGDLCFAPKVTEFLEAVFGEKALAFQTLHFEVGSTQAIHQDTAYVVVRDEPLKLVASWIALQDVTPGSGELIYHIGGHRIPDYPYAGGKSKHWNPERDGHPVHNEHLRYLTDQASAHQMPLGRFLPRKGDVLFWHADLPHGGSAITEPGLLRRSLVTHYCPISCMPHYSYFIPTESRIRTPAQDGNAFISLYFPPSQLWRGI
jgi:ectoine hydroxylase-related dioxygenase (phytanoyl-CoA dioxygenase family)